MTKFTVGDLLKLSMDEWKLDMLERQEEATARLAALTARDMPAPKRPGRPGWTDETFAERYRQARLATTEPKTETRIAANFRCLDGTVGILPTSLTRLRREHRPKPPG